MENKVPLSVVILAKNEAGRLRDCIHSVAWADDVLVIDDESADDTVAIAESLGARVLRRKMDIEGRHRNWAYAQAKHEWVLSLDADERVRPELAQEMQGLLGNGAPYETYAMPRKNYIGDRWIRHGGRYPSAQLKLFKRSVFRWEETTVHPRAISDRPCGTLEHDLIHYSYRNLHDFIAKMNWQTTLEAQKWVADGRRVTLGKALWRAVDRFFRAYIGKRGYRDGFLGFVVAALGGFYQFLSWAKYEEQRRPSPAAAADALADLSPGLSRPGGRATLSVVLMTKNEAHRLARCLDRVAGWADEIVVIDDLSEDGTRELAQRYTDKVFPYRSDDDHFKQWNRGIEHATGEWILHIDADELVTPALRDAMDQALSTQPQHAGFEVMRKNFYLGYPMRHGGWYHRYMNLFRRQGSRCIGKGIHARVSFTGTTGFLNADIEHYPFTSIVQFMERQNGYTSVEADVLVERRPGVRLREIIYQTTWRPVKLWWKFYVKKAGWRDGWPGFVFAVLWAFVHFLLWVKYWERVYGTRG